ncbi:hypothetical protein KIPB_008730 [Kipferlia bialata]|uniref:Uncharacterized protein n=1 Tax=Kipferlia bialata TaxID=797122 RepID=A0A9K3D171_9EUKA|nr:hypothetical protein KIPB_008730 [Kipferlia bialata]|eukprot:g8730.t1
MNDMFDDPVEGVHLIQDQCCDISKSRGVRFNEALRLDWYSRSIITGCTMPTSITYTTASGAYTLPVYMYTAETVHSSTFPLDASSAKSVSTVRERLVERDAERDSLYAMVGAMGSVPSAYDTFKAPPSGPVPVAGSGCDITDTVAKSVAKDVSDDDRITTLLNGDFTTLYLYTPEDGSGDIAVLRIPEWMPSDADSATTAKLTEWSSELTAMLTRIGNLYNTELIDGLVVDFRYNFGGWGILAGQFAAEIHPSAVSRSVGECDMPITPLAPYLWADRGEVAMSDYETHSTLPMPKASKIQSLSLFLSLSQSTPLPMAYLCQ